jgi:hypothetical protein
MGKGGKGSGNRVRYLVYFLPVCSHLPPWWRALLPTCWTVCSTHLSTCIIPACLHYRYPTESYSFSPSVFFSLSSFLFSLFFFLLFPFCLFPRYTITHSNYHRRWISNQLLPVWCFPACCLLLAAAGVLESRPSALIPSIRHTTPPPCLCPPRLIQPFLIFPSLFP